MKNAEILRGMTKGQTAEIICSDRDTQLRCRHAFHTAALRQGVRVKTTCDSQWLNEEVPVNEGKWPLIVERL